MNVLRILVEDFEGHVFEIDPWELVELWLVSTPKEWGEKGISALVKREDAQHIIDTTYNDSTLRAEKERWERMSGKSMEPMEPKKIPGVRAHDLLDVVALKPTNLMVLPRSVIFGEEKAT